MDVTSYLLGKQAGGGGTPTLQDKSVTITENGTTNVTADTGYDGLSEVEITTNVSGGGSQKIKPLTLSFSSNSGSEINTQMIDTSLLTTFRNMFTTCVCEELDLSGWDASNVTRMDSMFQNCSNLKTVKIGNLFDTSKVTNMNSMFYNCSNLIDVPVFNASRVTNFGGMFQNIGSELTDQSLDNILLTCISATSYTGTKKLSSLGLPTSIYLESRIQTLPHYQDFINAGWAIS